MKINSSHFFNLLLTAFLFLTASCSRASTASLASAETLLVASTPGGDSIKAIFRIPAEKNIDFIRWSLILNEDKSFDLNISFGEGEPNTSGFKSGGEKLSVSGNFSQKGRTYELQSESLSAPILLVKLNENLFHLLTEDGKLMVGNGGWSYSLNRKDLTEKTALVSWKSNVPDKTTEEVVFGGRTPCLELAQQYNWQVGNDCIKLKWKLILYRDAGTNEPTTYALSRTFHRQSVIEGKWIIKSKAEAVIYQLDPDKPDESISFLVGDENVLFFLDKQEQLFKGNSDFSFTLNRSK